MINFLSQWSLKVKIFPINTKFLIVSDFTQKFSEKIFSATCTIVNKRYNLVFS